MADVGSERERVAEPRDIVKDVIFLLLFFFLFLLMVFVLIHDLSHPHMMFRYEPTFSKYLKHISELITEARDNHQLTIALAEEP